MSSPRSATRCSRGAALVPALCVVVGLLLGLAAAIAPRFWNVDIMRWITPPAESAPAAVAPKSAPAAAPSPAVHPKEIELRRLIVDVQKQRAMLDEREKHIAARTAQIERDNKALAALKTQMDEVETRMKAASLEVEDSEKKNVKRLAKMWAQMEPDEVVKLIKSLDSDVAAKVMAAMTERQAAPILGAIAVAPGSEKMASELVQKLRKIKVVVEVAKKEGL